jgi:hypothetical protein
LIFFFHPPRPLCDCQDPGISRFTSVRLPFSSRQKLQSFSLFGSSTAGFLVRFSKSRRNQYLR